ncbi:MAG: signal recognition particle protein [Thermoguttaceae bacterium]|jgi:signal recognition particle subunit SRP54
MFESLQESLGSAFRTMLGRGRITESNIREGMALVRKSLLEADVSVSVVRDFVARVTEKSLGEEVVKVLNPTEQIVKIVNDELVALMGPVDPEIPFKKPLTVLMLCGLQGSGKTTTCGKLGHRLRKQGLKPMFVAADLQRPAAIDQLEVLGNSLGIPVYTDRVSEDPVAVCRAASQKALAEGYDVLILDTAGRLHIDEELMEQLKRIERQLNPDQVYFVVDSMTGQDAVNSAQVFNDALELDGVILTKLDGDSRGGAALSVKSVTGVPIKFIGTGETLDDLDEFHPERMASRILGMGDLATLIESAQSKIDEDELLRQQERLEKGLFTLDDFRRQMSQITRLGSFGKILSFLPGMGQLSKMMGSMDIDPDRQIRKIGGIIDSMTAEERKNPRIIDQRRRRRIANGAGVAPNQISELLKMFYPMADMMKQMGRLGPGDRMRAVQMMTQQVQQGAYGQNQKKGTGKRLTAKERMEQRKRLEKERKKKKRR